jgi:carbon monoxide dehydrogenase subunit G
VRGTKRCGESKEMLKNHSRGSGNGRSCMRIRFLQEAVKETKGGGRLNWNLELNVEAYIPKFSEDMVNLEIEKDVIKIVILS